MFLFFSENKWDAFDVIYYEYGSLVVTYSNTEIATRALTTLRESRFDDKQFVVLLLPNIQVRLVFECYLIVNRI